MWRNPCSLSNLSRTFGTNIFRLQFNSSKVPYSLNNGIKYKFSVMSVDCSPGFAPITSINDSQELLATIKNRTDATRKSIYGTIQYLWCYNIVE